VLASLSRRLFVLCTLARALLTLIHQVLFRHEPKKARDFLDFLSASFFKSGVICRAARQILPQAGKFCPVTVTARQLEVGSIFLAPAKSMFK
jgi:hypothetical protein